MLPMFAWVCWHSWDHGEPPLNYTPDINWFFPSLLANNSQLWVGFLTTFLLSAYWVYVWLWRQPQQLWVYGLMVLTYKALFWNGPSQLVALKNLSTLSSTMFAETCGWGKLFISLWSCCTCVLLQVHGNLISCFVYENSFYVISLESINNNCIWKHYF